MIWTALIVALCFVEIGQADPHEYALSSLARIGVQP